MDGETRPLPEMELLTIAVEVEVDDDDLDLDFLVDVVPLSDLTDFDALVDLLVPPSDLVDFVAFSVFAFDFLRFDFDVDFEIKFRFDFDLISSSMLISVRPRSNFDLGWLPISFRF